VLGGGDREPELQRVLPDHWTVAWWCFREAAEVYTHPEGMGKLASCYNAGRGVVEDRAQAAVWFQRAADLGDAPSKASIGAALLQGDARAGVAMDAFKFLCEAVDQGQGLVLYLVATCYLAGGGVEKDAVHGVSLLRQVTNQEDDTKEMAERALAVCYMEGNGVEADTVQAALWCQRAADGGDAHAIELLALIRTCDFCGTTPTRKHCERCRKVRYCNATCQAAHWNRETDPHKGHCRRAAEASQQETGGASTSAQQ